MIPANVRLTEEPQADRPLGRLAAAALEAIEHHPDNVPGVRVMVLVDTDDDGSMACAGRGDKPDPEVMLTDLMNHATSMIKVFEMGPDQLADILGRAAPSRQRRAPMPRRRPRPKSV